MAVSVRAFFYRTELSATVGGIYDSALVDPAISLIMAMLILPHFATR